MSRRFKLLAFTLLFILLESAAAGLTYVYRDVLKTIDERYFGQRAIDFLGRVVWKEEWEALPAIREPFDYRWLDEESQTQPIFVAHGMGASGTGQNTLRAFDLSVQAGFRLIEGDFWLSKEGDVFCFHGPSREAVLSAEAIQADFKSRGVPVCKFEDVARYIRSRNVWLILDIKTSFYGTALAILRIAEREGVINKIIFQLYRPADVELLYEWRERFGMLPGPIVTAYLSKRALRTVAEQAYRIGIRALTFPIRLIQLAPDASEMTYFVHPINACDDLKTVLEKKVQGVYSFDILRCMQ